MARAIKEKAEPKVNFKKMTLQQLEELVGQKPTAVEMRGQWIVCAFNNITISFKKW